MKRIILAVLLTFSHLVASAGYYDGVDSWVVTSDTTTRTVSGGFAVAASTKTWRNFVTRIDGTNGITSSLQVTASSFTSMGSMTAKGSLFVDGNATITGPSFSVGGSTLVVANGGVGIGVANPSNIFTPLRVSGSINYDESIYTAGIISAINTYNGNGAIVQQWQASGATPNNQLSMYATGGNMALQSRKYSDGAVSNILLNPSGGKVGINTTTPDELLHIKNGFLKVEEPDAVSGLKMGQFIQSNAGQDRALVIEYPGDIFNIQGYESTMTDVRNFTLQKQGGKVGIGIAPGSTLHVVGDQHLTGPLTVLSSATVGGGLDLRGQLNMTDNQGVFWGGAGGVARGIYANAVGLTFRVNTDNSKMNLLTNGNLGLGLATPLSKLHVIGDATISTSLTASSGTFTGALGIPLMGLYNSAVPIRIGWGIDSAGTQYGMGLYFDGTRKFTIEDNSGLLVGANYQTANAPANGAIIEGSVGIGTTAPGAKLEVNGNVVSSGTIQSDSAHFDLATATSTFAGWVDIGYELVSNFCGVGVGNCVASCPAGKRILGGGGFITTAFAYITTNYPVNETWVLGSDTSADRTSYAICARIK